jgi:diketogulonate reductase-like aldo/keto reductase
MQTPLVTLNNDVQMPQLGLGVYQVKDGQEVESTIATALANGYRLIDTAMLYGNEEGVGHAIAASNIPRKDIFVTTKLWNTDQGYERTFDAFEASSKRLGLDYIDLYLIHWPAPAQNKYVETWKAFEKLYEDGKVKAIGVSNFLPEHLERLLSETEVTPAINQIELHPGFLQKETRDFCKAHGIAVEAWSPLGGSQNPVVNMPEIVAIAKQYGKSPAQIVLRWHIQHGFIVIPKSTRPEQIAQNIDIFGFELTDETMQATDAIGDGDRRGPDPRSFS